MIRRALRIAAAWVSLLSLLAAIGTACLWWESRSGQGYVADASLLGTYAAVELLPGSQGGVLVVRRWPGRARFHLWSQHAYYEEYPISFRRPSLQVWHRLSLYGHTGTTAVLVRTDTGEPLRWDGKTPQIVAVSGPMSVWSIFGIPPWGVIAG